jgi:hypothetical protein
MIERQEIIEVANDPSLRPEIVEKDYVPYSLRRSKAGRVLLYAVRSDSQDVRCYRLDRIVSARPPISASCRAMRSSCCPPTPEPSRQQSGALDRAVRQCGASVADRGTIGDTATIGRVSGMLLTSE